MKKLLILMSAVCAMSGCNSAPDTDCRNSSENYDVAAYVWPAYHPAPRWRELGIFAHGNGEWQNVYEAKSKRAGHKQPI